MTDIQIVLLAALALLQLILGFVLLFYSLRNQHESNQMLGRLLGGPQAMPTQPPAKVSPAPAAVPQPVPVPHTPTGPPAWFTWAQHEVGFHEAPGNTGIGKYIDLAHCGAEGDPWCAIFANAALEASGVPGTRSASSQSFRTHPAFIQIQTPVVGCIVVFWRISKSSGQGHVGFYVGEDATHVSTLGGNENDAVQIEALPKSSATFGLIGYWWPKSIPLTTGGPISSITKPAAVISTTSSTAPTHQTGIIATVFGGQQSAYGGAIDDNSPGVALPFRFTGTRPKVIVTSATGSLECSIVDVGPWNINDPYWNNGTRPQAESGIDMTGRKTNKAGIDLTVAAAKTLGIDGKGLVSWNFTDQPPTVT
jgi:uncharacterized protein (TIGR02594 family)